jgi:hypothetical protein
MLGKLDLDRALTCSERRGKHGLWCSFTLIAAVYNLTCHTDDLINDPTDIRCLRGSVKAFVIVSQLAKRDGWKRSPCPCAAAVRSASPTLRDVCAWRAVSIVGIADRSMYLYVLNTCSEYALEKDPALKSQMLMAFETNFGHLPEAFQSKSSKNPCRRGMVRQTLRNDDKSKDAIEAETPADGSNVNAASSSFWPHEKHIFMV